MGRVAPMGRARARQRSHFAVAAALLLLAACATPTPDEGVLHIVQAGENLYRLSQRYGVSVEAIRDANDIRDVRQLQVGQELWIPGTSQASAGAASRTRRAANGASRAQALRESGVEFDWPVDGALSSDFGRRGRDEHDGIDIPAKRGTAVRAAEAGRVIYSGDLGDYGQVVIVKHAGRYSTVYAHNRRNRVDKGEFVEKGQRIAEVGSSGNASGSHVHFEVRRDRRPEDPLAYLP